jgi:serine protease Do
VIGINTAIVSDRPSNLGIGFAVPINTVRDLLPQLRSGRVTRGKIGVEILAVTNDDVEYFGLDERLGAVVMRIAPGGPADDSDLEVEDVIVSYNGERIEHVEDLQQKVVDTQPGTVVELGVYRGGEPRTLPITIGELDLEAENRPSRPDPVEDLNTGFGMSLQDLTAESARRLNLAAGTTGAVVTGVDPNGAALTGGVQPDDLIITVNREPITTAAGAILALNRVPSGSTAFLVIVRGDSRVLRRLRKE